MTMGGKAESARLQEIKNAVEDAARLLGLHVAKIYLFGSRARGEADAKSDWDLLVVVKGQLSWDEHRKLFCEISQRLARIGVPADIVIRTEAQLEESLRRVASIEKEAIREGIPL